jgi:hypothetical protein
VGKKNYLDLEAEYEGRLTVDGDPTVQPAVKKFAVKAGAANVREPSPKDGMCRRRGCGRPRPAKRGRRKSNRRKAKLLLAGVRTPPAAGFRSSGLRLECLLSPARRFFCWFAGVRRDMLKVRVFAT